MAWNMNVYLYDQFTFTVAIENLFYEIWMIWIGIIITHCWPLIHFNMAWLVLCGNSDVAIIVGGDQPGRKSITSKITSSYSILFVKYCWIFRIGGNEARPNRSGYPFGGESHRVTYFKNEPHLENGIKVCRTFMAFNKLHLHLILRAWLRMVEDAACKLQNGMQKF